MIINNVYLIIPLIFLAALLFSSVGHGGASAYLATFALVGMAPESMRPAALCLNVLVSSIALYKFYKAGAFDWQLFWPIAIASIPAAFLGGQISLPNNTYNWWLAYVCCMQLGLFTLAPIKLTKLSLIRLKNQC